MKSIDVHQLHAREGVPLIDVREEHEFAGGHVPGSVNLPMSTIGSRLDELPEGPFDVICQVGGRSARVVEALEAAWPRRHERRGRHERLGRRRVRRRALSRTAGASVTS